jgi:peptidoglycan/LPS O-acetylase OafA/YrhL
MRRGSTDPGRWLYDFLRRRTSSRAFLPQVDGLRWYAIAAVVLHHCAGYAVHSPSSPHGRSFQRIGVEEATVYGAVGVNLFFVISGFVLGLPLAHAAAHGTTTPSYRSYLLRRAARIKPPYVINLLALGATRCLARGERLTEIVPHLAASLCYCHGLIYGTFSTINFVAWSLEIEVQFYLLAPLLGVIFRLPGWATRIVVAAAIGVASVLLAEWMMATGFGQGRARLTLLPFLPFFLGGFLLADAHVRGVGRRRSTAGDLLALPCLAGVAWFGRQAGAAATGGLAVSLVGLCYSGIVGRWHSRMLSWPPLVVVGGMCYTIYLYHTYVMAAAGPWLCRSLAPLGGGPWAFLILMTAFAAVITAVCIPLYLLFEKPFMGVVGGRVSQGPEALPAACRVLPATVPFVVPGFERQHRREDYVLAPAVIDSRAWFDRFATRVEDAVGRRYLPVCRLADGEYEFLFGPTSWNPRLPPFRRTMSAARAMVWRWRHQRPGFHAETAQGISSGDLTDEECRALRPIVRNDLGEIARHGILAMHLSYGREPFHEAYFPAIRAWVQQGGLAMNERNYVPFYFVYALLRGPRAAGLLGGRRLLVVHSADGAKRAAIRRSLLDLGAADVQWIGVSPNRAFAEQLDVRSLAGRPDLCLVGAGIGKTRVLRQLEPLAVPCIDAGFVFEVWADADRQWDRPFMTPDTAFSPRLVRYISPSAFAGEEGA